MIRKLLSHDWKALRRSTFFTKSILATIGLGFLALYFFLMAIAVGVGAGFMIKEAYPEKDALQLFSSFFVIYLFGDLMIRFLFQKYPSIAIQKYLTLNVSKRFLSHYVSIKSIFSFFNFFPLFVIIPFFFISVIGDYSTSDSFSWLITVLSFILINNFLSYYLDRIFGKQPVISFIILGLISTLLFLHYKGYIDILGFIEPLTPLIFINWISTVIIIFIVIAVYYLLYTFLRNNAYLDSENDKQNTSSAISFSLFNQFGDIGKWMQLEAKLIWRNKRPRQFLYVTLLFMFYPFMIGVKNFDSNLVMILLGIFLTGAFIMNYGQLLLAWNSAHFNLILTQNFPLKKYLRSKYYLLAMSSFALSFLALPYGFFNIKFLLVVIAMCCYNVGITIPIYLFLSIYAAKRIDLKKGTSFNYEGYGVLHFLIILPVMLPPLLVYLIFYFLDLPDLAILLLFIVGVAGILFREKTIDKSIEKLKERKYILQTNLNTDA